MAACSVDQWSVDLLAAATNEWRLGRSIAGRGEQCYQAEVLINAVRRYEQCWLPLLHHRGEPDLVPPLDVHFVWHTHGQSPECYREDCLKIVGRVPDQRLWSEEEMEGLAESSAQIWRSYFPCEPYHALDLSPTTAAVSQLSLPYDQQSSYDLVSAAQRERNFHFQTGLPHYGTAVFLSAAVDRYERFLLLHQRDTRPLAPPLDVRLVWRGHRAHHAAYLSDTQRALGRVLPSDAEWTTADRCLAEQTMEELWKAHWPNEPLQRAGAVNRMYDSPSVLGLKSPSPDDRRRVTMRVSSLSLTCNGGQRSWIGLQLLHDDRMVADKRKQLDKEPPSKQQPCRVVWEGGKGKPLATIAFHYDRRTMKHLKVKIEQKGEAKLTTNKDRSSITAVYPMEEVLRRVVSGGAVRATCQGVMGDALVDARLDARASVALMSRLLLRPGYFHSTTLKQGSGPLFELACVLAPASDRSAIQARTASHWLIDARRDAQYAVDVVHPADGLYPFVVVRDRRQRPLAVLHQAHPFCLPLALPQATDYKMERLVSVVNSSGDFSIIKANWRADLGENGAMMARIFYPRSGSSRVVQLPEAKKKARVDMEGSSVDFESNRMDCNSVHTAEYIACAFGLALLFWMCKDEHEGGHSKRPTVPEWPFLAALGVDEDWTGDQRRLEDMVVE